MDVRASAAGQSLFNSSTVNTHNNAKQLVQSHCSPSGRLDSLSLANTLHQCVKQDQAAGSALCMDVMQCLQNDHHPMDAKYFAQDLMNSFNSDPDITMSKNPTEDDGPLDKLFHFISEWHFEGRAERNNPLPSYEEAIAAGSEWQLLSPAQSVFHDNGKGEPELKFIHPDGREAVFDGDTLQLVTDDKYIGTYNYVNPAPVPDKWSDIGGWADYAGKGLGHLVLDVLPYAVGGNVRGEN